MTYSIIAPLSYLYAPYLQTQPSLNSGKICVTICHPELWAGRKGMKEKKDKISTELDRTVGVQVSWASLIVNGDNHTLKCLSADYKNHIPVQV